MSIENGVPSNVTHKDRPRKPARKVRLPRNEVIILAGIFARSNMGLGNPDKATVERMKASANPSVSSAVMATCGDFMETNEHQEMFEEEGRGWVRQLSKMSQDDVRNTWPDIATLMWG
jgi:hypothetical protein